jgi:hypothetical protein
MAESPTPLGQGNSSNQKGGDPIVVDPGTVVDSAPGPQPAASRETENVDRTDPQAKAELAPDVPLEADGRIEDRGPIVIDPELAAKAAATTRPMTAGPTATPLDAKGNGHGAPEVWGPAGITGSGGGTLEQRSGGTEEGPPKSTGTGYGLFGPKHGADDCLTAAQLQAFRTRASAQNVTNEIVDELSAALGLGEAIRGRDIYIEGAADRLNFILDCLIADHAKLNLARDERIRMQLDVYQKTGVVSRILAKISAGSPVALVLTALAVSLVIWAGLVLGIRALVDSRIVAVARDIFFMNGQALAVMTSAAFVGGVVSIATRMKEFSAMRDLDPFAVFWTALFKPLIGVVLSLFILATLAGGVITLGFLDRDAFTLIGAQGLDAANTAKAQASLYVLFVLGFLAGFSERFAWDFVDRTQGVASGGLTSATTTSTTTVKTG